MKTYKEGGNKDLMALVSSTGVKHKLGHRNVIATERKVIHLLWQHAFTI